MSRRPGIGSNYLDTHAEWHLEDARYYTNVNGVMGRLPRYYKEKIFRDPDRFVDEDLDRKVVLHCEYAQHLEEIYELSKVHHDPNGYYIHAKKDRHKKIKHKSNSRNKF